MKKQKSIEDIKNVKEQLKEIDYKIWTFFEQKIKEKDQRIAELEEENARFTSDLDRKQQIIKKIIDISEKQKEQLETKVEELEEEIRLTKAERDKWKYDCENCSELERMECNERQYCLDNWRACEKENAKLQEQLKNAIMSKFKVGDKIFVNLTDMDFAKKTFCFTISGIEYRYILETIPYGRFDERDLFATEEEAKQHWEKQL